MASVDIAIPCDNYGRFLGDCVQSILSQGIAQVRVLIVDNASTDDSLTIAQHLAEQDHRIEVLARPVNLGPHASFNAGVEWASGDYFMVLCADDLLAPGALRRAVAIMEANPRIGFAIGTDIHLSADATPPATEPEQEARWRIVPGLGYVEERCRNPEHYIAAGMVLVRTAVQKRAGLYRPELPHTDDFEMLLRLARFADVAVTDTVLGYKRMHGSNRTHDYLAVSTRDLQERLAAVQSFAAHEGSDLPDPGRFVRLTRHALAQRAYWSATKRLVCGQLGTAMELFRFAFRLSPRTAVLPPVGYLLRMDRSAGEIAAGLFGRARAT